MKKLILIIPFLLIMAACKKTAGEGGKAKITGTIWVEEWDGNFLVKRYEYAGLDEEVYIIYGDHTSEDDKVTTNYNGTFEFKYLRKVKYKIYIFSDKKQSTSSPNNKEAIIKEVEITSTKQVINLDTLTVLR